MSIFDKIFVSMSAMNYWHHVVLSSLNTEIVSYDKNDFTEQAELMDDGTIRVFVPAIPKATITLHPDDWTWRN